MGRVRNASKSFFGALVSTHQAKYRADSCHSASWSGAGGGLCLGLSPEQCGLASSTELQYPIIYTLNSGVYQINLTVNDGSTGYAFGCVPVPGSTNEYTYCLLLCNINSGAYTSSGGPFANPSFTVSNNSENTFNNYILPNSTTMLSVAAGGGGGGCYLGGTTQYGGNGGSGGNLFYGSISPILNNSYSFSIGAGGNQGYVNPTPGYCGGPNTIVGPYNMIVSPRTYNVLTTPIPTLSGDINPNTSSITNSSTNCTIKLAGGNGGYCWNQTLKHDTPGNTAWTIGSNYNLELITNISGNEYYTSANETSVGSVGNGGQTTHTCTPYNGCMGISFGLGNNNNSSLLQGALPYIPCFSTSNSTFNNPSSGHPVNFGGGGGGGQGCASTSGSVGGGWGAYTSSSTEWQQFYEDSSYYYAGRGATAYGGNTEYGYTGSSSNGQPPYLGLYTYPSGFLYSYNYGWHGGGGGGGGGNIGGYGANGFTLIMWTEIIYGVPNNSTQNKSTLNMKSF
jgi:hypothetical protein